MYIFIFGKKKHFKKISMGLFKFGTFFFKFQLNPNFKNKEIFKNIFIPNIKMYTFFHHRNDEEKWLVQKNQATVAL